MKMMKIESIVEDIVLLILENHEPLAKIGIKKDKLFVKIKGYDENGIWIHHPSFELPNKKSKKKLKATILIPWAFIISIVHFPEAEGYDFPNPFEQSMGF